MVLRGATGAQDVSRQTVHFVKTRQLPRMIKSQQLLTPSAKIELNLRDSANCRTLICTPTFEKTLFIPTSI